MGLFDSIASDLTGGLIGGGGGPLSGVISGGVSKDIHGLSNDLQTAGMGVADYFTGGLASLADPMLSKGSQNQLSSPLGRDMQIGASIAGDISGGGFTGASFGGDSTPGPGGPLNFGDGSVTIDPTTGLPVNAPVPGTTPIDPTTGLPSTAPASSQINLANSAQLESGAANPSVATQLSPAAAQAAGGVADPAPAAAAGNSGVIQSAINSLKNPITDLQLGVLAKSMLSPAAQLNPNLMAGAAPSQAVSQQLLQQFQTGTLNPADQYNIAQWEQNQTQSVKQYYQNAGLGNSSMAQQAIAQVGQQAQAMRQQAQQNLLQGGLSAAGVANSATGNAVQLQVQQDAQTQALQAQFMKNLALMSTQQTPAS